MYTLGMIMVAEPETLRSLLHNRAHWEFELIVGFIEMVIFDVIIGGLAWPFVKKHWNHHVERDEREGIK